MFALLTQSGLMRTGLPSDPGEDDGRDDQDIARDDGNDQPGWQRTPTPRATKIETIKSLSASGSR